MEEQQTMNGTVNLVGVIDMWCGKHSMVLSATNVDGLFCVTVQLLLIKRRYFGRLQGTSPSPGTALNSG
jgi:hypothetical protein